MDNSGGWHVVGGGGGTLGPPPTSPADIVYPLVSCCVFHGVVEYPEVQKISDI